MFRKLLAILGRQNLMHGIVKGFPVLPIQILETRSKVSGTRTLTAITRKTGT